MSERYFFDTSAFLAILRGESTGPAIQILLDGLKARQKVTSVLVAYELYRGISPGQTKARAQRLALDRLLADFNVKPLTNAHAMSGAKLHRYSRGFADPLLGAQCLDGGFILVTTNPSDFGRMPGIQLARF